MSLKKITIRTLIIGLIIVSGLGVAYRYAEGRDFFFSEIASLLEDSTGYTIEKSGPLELDLFPRPGVTIRSLALSNPYSILGEQFFRAETLSLRLDWVSILRFTPVVDVDIYSTSIALEVDSDGSPNWMTPQLLVERDDTSVEFDKVSASGLKFRFRNHQTDQILEMDIDHIDSDVESGLTSAFINSAGQLQDQRFRAQGEVRYQRADMRIDVDLEVSIAPASQVSVAEAKVPSISDWIEKRKPSFPINGSILGSVTITESLPHGQLQFQAEANTLGDLTFLGEKLNFLQADLGPVLANGKLQIRGNDLDIDNLQVGIKLEKAGINAHGSMQNLLSQTRLNLFIRGQAARLEQLLTPTFLEDLTTLRLSPLKSIKFASSLDYEGTNIKLTGIEADFRHRSLNASIKGDLHIGEDATFSSVEVAAEATDPVYLLDLFGVEDILPPDIGPIKVKGRVKSENDAHTIEDGTLDASNIGLKGSVSGTLDASGENLRFDLEPLLHIKDLALIARIYSDEVALYLEDLSGKATGKISGTPKDFTLRKGAINLFQEDRELHLSGQLVGLPDNLESDFTFQYLTDRPFGLDSYFPQLEGLQLTGPMELSGAARSTGKQIIIEKARLQAKQTDVKGEATLDLGVSPPQITASFIAENFVTDLFDSSLEAASEEVQDTAPELDTEIEPEPQTETDQKRSAQELAEAFKAYTSSILINTDWIEALNFFISFTAGKARIGDYIVDDLNAVVSARNGIFSLEKYEFLLGGEPINIHGLIDSTPELPRYELEGKLMGDTLSSLLNMDGGLLDGGKLQGEFKLNSNGNTVGELIEHLNGQATVEMGPLILRSRILRSVSSGIFGTMLSGILRKNSDEAVSEYQCGVMGIDIRNGIANIKQTLSLQAEDYNLGGNGRVDLNTGFVDIRVVPRARKGLGLSVSTIVGGFKVRGHMATPDLGLGGTSLFTAAVLGYALAPTLMAGAMVTPVTATVVATGYLTQGVIHRMTASNFTCENTLKRIQRNRVKLEKSSGKPVPAREF